MPRSSNIYSLEEEKRFLKWYEGWSKKLGLNPDPYDPLHHYDYKAAWRSGAIPDKEGHWPSKFKKDSHPNLIITNINTKTGERIMPNFYGGYNYNPGFDLFGDGFSITPSIDDEALRRSLLEIEEEKRKRDLEELEKKDKKAARRKRLVEAIPFIAAAITAKDGGQGSRVLLQYADLIATKKEQEERRKHELRRDKEAREAREEEREDVQKFSVSEREASQLFSREERLAGQGFATSERIAAETSRVDSENRGFTQELIKIGLNNSFTREIQEILHNYRTEEVAQGNAHNALLQSRRLGAELGQRLSRYMRVDTAQRLADKVTNNAPLNEVEVGILNWYGSMQLADTEMEKKSLTVDMLYKLSNIEVPAEPDFSQIEDPQRRELVERSYQAELLRGGKVPTTKLPIDEIAKGLGLDLGQVFSPTTDPSQIKTSTGETLESLSNQASFEEGSKFILEDNNVADSIKSAAKNINSDFKAAQFGRALFQTYGYNGAKGILSNLILDPQYRSLVETAIEEAQSTRTGPYAF